MRTCRPLALCLLLLSAAAHGLESQAALPSAVTASGLYGEKPTETNNSETEVPTDAIPSPPENLQFGSLIDAAEFYLSLPQRGWEAIDDGPLLRVGDRSSQIEALRRRLKLYGDYKLPLGRRVELALFDPELAQALGRFQRRHGLKPDGLLGPDTRRALNVLPAARAYQLLLNHERQLALRKRAPQQYIQVNVPEFRLRVFRDHQPVMEMKAIVGRVSRQTPTLESEIKSLVVNPAWNVPRSIALKDILPKWQADAQYLDRHNMKIVSGWGNQKVWVDPQQTRPEQMYRGREYFRLYQLPGAKNALGQIKFDFPNPYAVYLHDTPSKSLFNKYQRAFSSGCVRLENPRRLAHYLLGTQRLKQPLEVMLEKPATRRIRLAQPVGLYLTYWTAWLDPQRGVQFREDIYQQDPLQPQAFEPESLAMRAADLQGRPGAEVTGGS